VVADGSVVGGMILDWTMSGRTRRPGGKRRRGAAPEQHSTSQRGDHDALRPHPLPSWLEGTAAQPREACVEVKSC
jgi:hypothetical protein